MGKEVGGQARGMEAAAPSLTALDDIFPVRGGRWVVIASLLLVGFAAGWLSAAPTFTEAGPASAPVRIVDDLRSGVADPRLAQAADPRELIPLPGPGLVPGEGETVPAECLLALPDGQLFQLPAPGQGDLGPGGGAPELIPLVPVPSPAPPSTPVPSPRQGPPPGTLRM